MRWTGSGCGGLWNMIAAGLLAAFRRGGRVNRERRG
jgi:hypothetical protein